jgi:hypothetical protein
MVVNAGTTYENEGADGREAALIVSDLVFEMDM